MSRPLVMSFRPDALDLCRAGVKTRTRRIWKEGWELCAGVEERSGELQPSGRSVCDGKGRVLWKTGETIGLKRKRTGCVEERVLCASLRAERVQDITEEEAIAEGMTPLADPAQCATGAPPLYTDGHGVYATARAAFEATWRRLNRRGAVAWDANPLVVVIGLAPIRPLDTSRVEALVEKYTAVNATEQRIVEVLTSRGGRCQYHELMDLVFPSDGYPRAFRRASHGGPPGCAMAFGAALRRLGCSDLGAGSSRVVRMEVQS